MDTRPDSIRKSIYHMFPKGWDKEKMVALNQFSERTGYDWDCIGSKYCKKSFGPEGYKRCTNCLGRV